MIEGIAFRYRAGIAWRDLPERFGPWQAVWKRHHRFSVDGTWDGVLAILQAEADAAGQLDWRVSVDSTTSRVHQHGSTAARSSQGPRATQGAKSNHKKRRRQRGRRRRLGPWRTAQRRGHDPGDHAIGRSRGGLSCKTHAIVDGHGRPLAIAVTPGQAGDSPQLLHLLAELSVDRL